MNYKKGISRRDFVKKTSLTAGSGLLLSSMPVGAMAYGAGSDVLKVAVIGCGGRGTGAANQALVADPGTKIVALADAFRDRIDNCYESLSRRYGDTDRLDVPEEHKFTGLDSFKHATALADVVILAAPPGFRPAHFEEAVKLGKHVFMEKPVATDAPGARRVLDAARKAKEQKLNVVVGLQRHYQNNYRETAKRVKDGKIGDIISGQVYWNDGGVWVNERQPDQTEMEYQIRNWYYFNWLCGDHILEQHIHNIDVANWFIGEYPERANGMGGREVRTDKKFGQIFDHHFVEFTYPGGAKISSQCRHQPNTYSRVDEVFQGTGGNINISGGGNSTIVDRSGNELYYHDQTTNKNPYQVEHDELFASIRNGGVISDGENGAYSTLAAVMGRMATYSGQEITWQQVLNSEKVIAPDILSWNDEPPVLPDDNGYYPVPVPGVSEPH